jgi:hypothetical protein
MAYTEAEFGRRAFLLLLTAISSSSVIVSASGCGEEEPPAQRRGTKPNPPRTPSKSSPAPDKPASPP